MLRSWGRSPPRSALKHSLSMHQTPWRSRLFDDADTRLGEPDVIVYNAATAPTHGPIAELDAEAVRRAIEISAYGGFLVVQQAARRMIPHGRGAILLTGASASVKGYALSAAFAMGNLRCVV